MSYFTTLLVARTFQGVFAATTHQDASATAGGSHGRLATAGPSGTVAAHPVGMAQQQQTLLIDDRDGSQAERAVRYVAAT